MEFRFLMNGARQSVVMHGVRIASLLVSFALAILAGHGAAIRGVSAESIAQVCVAVVSMSVHYVLHHTGWGAKVLGVEQIKTASEPPAATTTTAALAQTAPIAATPQELPHTINRS